MIDVKQTVANSLSATNIPVYYELFVDSSTNIPCITYYEANNADRLVGDTVEYGDISLTLKLWDYTVANLETNAALVDAKMRGLGFRKSSSYITFVNGLGQYLLRYDGIGYKK